jgi:alpha-tubulin suppressor-like RCC1 family protein
MLNPSVVNFPEKMNVVYGSSGHHMFALSQEGTVYAWGNNECFQLGINNKPPPEDEEKSTKSKGKDEKSEEKSKGKAKKGDEKGKKKVEEEKEKGKTKKGAGEEPKEEGEKKKRTRKRVKKDVVARPTEAKVINDMKEKIKKICGGESHTVLLTADGEVYSWGRNNFGQLGLGATDAVVEEPRKVEVEDIEDISCGMNHTVLVNKEGEVYAFGALKAAGIPTDNDNEMRPLRVCGKLKKNKVISVACGREHSLLVTEVEK